MERGQSPQGRLSFPGNFSALAAQLEELIATDVNGRGTEHLIVPGDLAAAGHSLIGARHVAIVTGFVILRAGAPETDGPPGALILARVLQRIGIEVTIMAERFALPVLQHAALTPWTEGLSVQATPAAAGELAQAGVTHLVAVECVGRAKDGHYYNAAGQLLDAYKPLADTLFLQAAAYGIETVCIGDGGNEIGMGKVYERVRVSVPLGERIGCIVPSDRLIVAGVSNWGAYGLAALLSFAAGLDLPHTAAEEAELVAALGSAGAVDGYSGEVAASVDGRPVSEHQRMVRRMNDLVAPYVDEEQVV